jgi:2-keto-4-pentenoate hydratase
VALSAAEVQRVAVRMLADYDAGRPNEIFAERGTDWLTLDDAYAVQHVVATLRRGRGEHYLGYKVGCVSATIQKQFGLRQPVRGYVWNSEAHRSGCHLTHTRFANLAIEGEIAVRLRRDVPADIANDDDLADYVECWFPIIELHNHTFRGYPPTQQELVAGNTMHAGFVAPLSPVSNHVVALAHAEIRVEVDGDLVEATTPGVLWAGRGPLGSVRWLASSLPKETLKAGDIVATGSPGRLISVTAGQSVSVTWQRCRVEVIVT